MNFEAFRVRGMEPGYFVFLGICFKIFGGNDNAVRLVQVFLSGLVTLLVYSLARQYYGENIGFISGLLYSLCPTFAHYPGFFLRETLIVFLYFLSYWLIIKSIDVKNISIAVAGAFSLFFLCLVKPIFLFFGLFVVSALCIFYVERAHWNRKLAVSVAIIVLLPILFYFTWIFWPSLSPDAYGKHKRLNYVMAATLLHNDSALALSPKEQTARLIGLISRNLSEKIFPEIDFHQFWPLPKIINQLEIDASKKYPHISEEGERLGRFTFDLYREHPFGYFVNRIATLIRLNAFQYLSRLNETDRWKDFYNRGNSKALVVIALDLILKFLSNPIFWALGGIIVMKKKKLPIFPILLPALYINLVYCFLYGIPRYGLPALPFYLIAGAVMFYYFLKTIEKRYPLLNKVTYIFSDRNLWT